MKNCTMKKRIAIGLAGLIIICCFGLDIAAAQAKDAYILKIDDGGKPYLYGSRYQCQLIVRNLGDETGTEYIYWNAPEIINLICGNGEENCRIGAYCIDGVLSQPVPGSRYRRINLEDYQQFAGDIAARLRAVLLNTFPGVTVEEIEVRVNEIMGEGSVRELTQGEVLAATQQALWKIAKGEAYSVDRNYVSIRGLSQYNTSEFVCPESLDACTESKHTRDNISNLYRYFLELKPVGPVRKVITEECVRDIGCEVQMQTDGTYTVTVRYEITAMPSEGDALKLMVACADQLQQRSLEEGEGLCIFTGLLELQPVEFTVSGYQTGADVYLFEKEGDPSDLLIGYDNSKLPVSIRRTVCPDSQAVGNRVSPEEPQNESDKHPGQSGDEAGRSDAPEKDDTLIKHLFQLMGIGFIGAAAIMVIIHAVKREFR